MLSYRLISTADLIPYARNSRTHSEAQVAKIASSIREFGFINPVVTDGKNGIVAGHGRVLAAHKLGLKEIPCVEASHLTEAQKRAYVIADNRMALDAGWDAEMLKVELGELQGLNFDLALTGFDPGELDAFLADKTDGLTDPDAVPETPVNAVSVLGDTWLLGKHRLRCGDSTSADDVSKLLNGQRADLCFTSPPYAQQREYKKEISDWDALMNGVFSILPVKDGAQVLVNLGLVHDSGKVNCYWDKWLDEMGEFGWPLFGWYVWDKGFGLPGNWNGRLAPAHEFIFHFSKGGNKPANKWVEKKPESIKLNRTTVRGKDGKMDKTSNPQAGLQPTKVCDSVIRITPQLGTSESSHPAMFPVALCEAIYKSYAKAGDWAYEPFSGSGTSIIACERMSMNCAAMELAPEYVDIACKRWQDFTGQKAVHEATGRTFEDMASDRYSPEADGSGSYTDAIAAKRAELEAAR